MIYTFISIKSRNRSLITLNQLANQLQKSVFNPLNFIYSNMLFNIVTTFNFFKFFQICDELVKHKEVWVDRDHEILSVIIEMLHVILTRVIVVAGVSKVTLDVLDGYI